MSLRNNLKNHLKVYGPKGLHSWNGGYDVNDDLPMRKIARGETQCRAWRRASYTR